MADDRMRKYRVFTKVPWDKRSIIYYVLLLFVSCLYPALFEGPRIKIISESASLMVASIFCSLFVFFLLMLSKYVFVVSCPILFYLGAISRLYASELHLGTTAKTAPLFTSNETAAFFLSSSENGIYLVSMFFLGLAIGAVRFFAADSSAVRRGQIFAVIVILAAGSARYMTETDKNFIPMPAAYVTSIQRYMSDGLHRTFFAKKKEPLKATQGITDTAVVLIVFDRMSDAYFNQKSAMPLAKAIRMNIFTGVEPCSKNTDISMMCTLTKASKEDFSPAVKKGTLLSLFSSAGYETHLINISNRLIKSSSFISEVKKEAHVHEEIKSAGAPKPFNAVSTIAKILENGGSQFIVVTIEGFLPEVKTRYPEIFNKARHDKDIPEAQYLDYMDFADAFIYEVSKKLENKKALILFAGLNGEEAGSSTDKTVFGIWLSSALTNEPGINKKIIKNGNINPTQSYIFSSIAGCAGLQSDEIEADKNICK